MRLGTLVDKSSFLAFKSSISSDLGSSVCATTSLVFNKAISSSLALRRAVMSWISYLSLSFLPSSLDILLNFTTLPSIHSYSIKLLKENVCVPVPFVPVSKGSPKCLKTLVKKYPYPNPCLPSFTIRIFLMCSKIIVRRLICSKFLSFLYETN